MDRRQEDEEPDVAKDKKTGSLRNHRDQPPLRPSRLDAGHRTLTAAGELTLKTEH